MVGPPDDRHHLLAAFRRQELDAAAERAIAQACREAGENAPRHPNASVVVDAHRARGVPVVGLKGGLGGAQRGSRPGNPGEWAKRQSTSLLGGSAKRSRRTAER